MFVSRFVKSAFRKAISLAFVSLLVTAGFAQNAAPQSSQSSMPPLTPMPQAPAPQNNAHLYSDQNYAKPQSPFPNVLAPYRVRNVPAPNLTNSARTDQLIPRRQDVPFDQRCGGNGAGEQPRHHLQRYNLSIADTDILLHQIRLGRPRCEHWSGKGTPGGATGATSAGGTGSGGAQGTGAGGTQLGVGGAGAGAAGIVTSTLGAGPPIDNFDPTITGTVRRRARHYASGEHHFYRHPQPGAEHQYLQLWVHPGVLNRYAGHGCVRQQPHHYQLAVYAGIAPGRIHLSLSLRQHLLQGFGFDPNLRWIRIARNNREIEDVVFRQQIITPFPRSKTSTGTW